jgi:hypothetical protein
LYSYRKIKTNIITADEDHVPWLKPGSVNLKEKLLGVVIILYPLPQVILSVIIYDCHLADR